MKCIHCGRVFKRESAFKKHECEPMRRYFARDTKEGKLALSLFNTFMKKTVTSEEFDKSSYYGAFMKFAKYCVDTKVFAPVEYMNYLLGRRIRVDAWAKDLHYNAFILAYIQNEPVASALERSVQHSYKWAQETGMNSWDIFRYGKPAAISMDIAMGRISPWALYQCDSGQLFINSIEQFYLQSMWKMIEPDYWAPRFKVYKEDVEWARTVLKTAGW